MLKLQKPYYRLRLTDIGLVNELPRSGSMFSRDALGAESTSDGFALN